MSCEVRVEASAQVKEEPDSTISVLLTRWQTSAISLWPSQMMENGDSTCLKMRPVPPRECEWKTSLMSWVVATGALAVVSDTGENSACSDSKEFKMPHSQFLGDLTRSWWTLGGLVSEVTSQ